MHSSNPESLIQRIDTILDILVAGDTRSAIHNLEILKAELIAFSQESGENFEPHRSWEI